jgi:hypothetical protein
MAAFAKKACFENLLVTAPEELADGSAFRMPGEKKWLALVADLIMSRRTRSGRCDSSRTRRY